MKIEKVEDNGIKSYHECKIYVNDISTEQLTALERKIDDNVPLVDGIFCMNTILDDGVYLRLRISNEFHFINGRFDFWDVRRLVEILPKWVEEVRKEIPNE